jgi:hypothetical protein
MPSLLQTCVLVIRQQCMIRSINLTLCESYYHIHCPCMILTNLMHLSDCHTSAIYDDSMIRIYIINYMNPKQLRLIYTLIRAYLSCKSASTNCMPIRLIRLLIIYTVHVWHWRILWKVWVIHYGCWNKLKSKKGLGDGSEILPLRKIWILF